MSRDFLVRTLRSPDAITRFSVSEWDTLVRQARAAGLLARLAHRFRRHGLAAAIPEAARWRPTTPRKLRRSLHPCCAPGRLRAHPLAAHLFHKAFASPFSRTPKAA